MSVVSIKRDSSMNVCIVRMICTDDLVTVSSANYIADQMENIRNLNDGFWQWFSSDVLLVAANDGNALFQFTDTTFNSLVLIASSTDGTVSAGLANQVAYYPVNGTTLAGTNTLPTQVQVPTGSLNNGLNANGAHFWRGDGIWATIASGTQHSAYTVWVAPDGNDTTGNGSINAPYKTINHALATITTASAATPFVIMCEEGIYNETTILLKPYVSINGQGSILNVTGDIQADPLWVNGGSIEFGNFQNVSISNAFNFNVSIAAANPCYARFYQMQFVLVPAFNVIGGDNLILILYGLYSFGATLYMYIENAYGAINGCAPSSLQYFATNTTVGFNFQFQDTYVIGNTSIITALGAVGVQSFFNSCKLLGAFTVNGTGCNINIDCNSLLLSSIPSIIGGAVVNYVNVANTLDANYTPIHYTPDATGGTEPATSVAAHLHGIDNALAASTTPVVTHDVWVSNQGSNASGDGTVSNPFQTIEYALSTITTNSPAQVFRIVCTMGVYNESTLSLKPWVFLEGNNAELNVLSGIQLDPSFAANGGDIVISNFYNCDITGGIVLNFSGIAPALNSTVIIKNFISYGNAAITVFGNDVDSNFTSLYLSEVDSLFGTVSFNIKDVSGALENCQYVSSLSYQTTNAGVGFAFNVFNCFFFGAITMQNVSGTGFSSKFNSNTTTNAFNITGSGANVTIDCNTISSSSIPVVSGGAIVSYNNISNTIEANYTPTNYTPVTSQVHGHLNGINNALAPIANIFGLRSTSSPTIVASTGMTGATMVFSIIDRIGDTVSINCRITCTPTVSSNSITLGLPYILTSFPDGLQCQGNGSFVRDVTPTPGNTGVIISINSIAATSNILVSTTAQSTGLAHTINLNFKYKIT